MYFGFPSGQRVSTRCYTQIPGQVCHNTDVQACVTLITVFFFFVIYEKLFVLLYIPACTHPWRNKSLHL